MKKIVNIKTIIIAMSVVLSLSSCDKDDTEVPQNTHDDAWGDVLLKKMDMMGSIMYLPVFFADGADIAATGSSVTGPDGTNYDLQDIVWMQGNKQTGGGSPSAVKPQAGTYTFHLKFTDGTTKDVTDELEATEIDVPMITVNYDQTAQTIQVDWTAVPNADLYCLKLTELDIANTKPFFKLPQLPLNSTSYTIHIDGSNGWMRPVSELQSGTEYYVVIAAKKVEQGKPVSGMSNDFQTSSCSKTKITY